MCIVSHFNKIQMNLEVKVKIDGGIGSNLYLISVSDDFQTFNHYFLGNDDNDVLKQFFTKNEWDEDFVKETYRNIGWYFDEDWDGEDGDGEETIDVELIGEVIQ